MASSAVKVCCLTDISTHTMLVIAQGEVGRSFPTGCGSAMVRDPAICSGPPFRRSVRAEKDRAIQEEELPP